MLKTMRQHAKYFYVLFFIVILSFVFWGVGTVDKTSSAEIVAEVGKYKITKEEYYRIYDRTYKFYRDLYKEKFDEDMQKKINLKENVLNSLIASRVLLIAAEQNGIKISDEELNETIINEPAFMNNGVFDNRIYQNTLRLTRLSPEGYEMLLRQDLTIKKISRIIELSVNTSENELTNVSANEQTLKAIKDAMIKDAQDKAVNAYVEGLKKGMKIKLYRQIIS